MLRVKKGKSGNANQRLRFNLIFLPPLAQIAFALLINIIMIL